MTPGGVGIGKDKKIYCCCVDGELDGMGWFFDWFLNGWNIFWGNQFWVVLLFIWK